MSSTRERLWAVGVGLALVGQASSDTDAAGRLTALVGDGRAYEYTRTLTERFGARVAASPAYERAAEWAAGELRSAGLRPVAIESFQIPRGWTRGRTTARLISRAPTADDRSAAGEAHVLHVEALGWTPATPSGGVEGEVVALADTSPGSVRSASVAGRIVFLSGTGTSLGTEGARDARRDGFDAALARAGALAVLIPDREGLMAAHPWQFGGEISRLPIAAVSRDDAALISRELARGTVRMAFECSNTTTEVPVDTHNVIADIPGRELPREWVIVGAHLDSWDPATGAQDNATGAAMVLEAARTIALLGRPPRRSLRFALWGAEEQGFLGSKAYLRAHGAETTRTVVVLNTDAGTGRILGWTAPGRADVADALRPLARRLLSDLGATAIDDSMQYAYDSDHAPFLSAGIPALDLNVDDNGYEGIHHTQADALDRVNARNLIVGATTVAITAYAIADAPHRIAPHRERTRRLE